MTYLQRAPINPRPPRNLSLGKGDLDYLGFIGAKPGCQIVVNDNPAARPKAFLSHPTDLSFYRTIPLKHVLALEVAGLIETCGRDCNGVHWRLTDKGKRLIGLPLR